MIRTRYWLHFNIITGLFHYDEDWRKVERKQDEDADIPTDLNHGISIDCWIKD